MRHQLFAIAALVAALGATARADTLTLGVGASIDVPDGWSAETTQSGYMMAASDQTVAIYLLDAAAASVDEAWQGIGAILGESIADLKIGKHKPSQVGGMDAQLATATGSDGTHELGLVVGVLTTPAGGFATLVIVSQKPDGLEHEAEVGAAVDSIHGLTPDPDDPFWALPKDAGDFARTLVAALDANDAKAVYAMLAAKVQSGEKMLKKAKLKKAITRAAKKHALAGYFHVADGAWSVHQYVIGSYELFRGDYAYLSIAEVKGKWVMDGYGTMSPD